MFKIRLKTRFFVIFWISKTCILPLQVQFFHFEFKFLREIWLVQKHRELRILLNKFFCWKIGNNWDVEIDVIIFLILSGLYRKLGVDPYFCLLGCNRHDTVSEGQHYTSWSITNLFKMLKSFSSLSETTDASTKRFEVIPKHPF